MHIYGIYKNGPEEFTYRAAMKKHTENRLVDMGRQGGEGEMHGKSNRETYITMCKIDSQRKFAVWLKKLKQGLCVILKGRKMGGGSGGRGYMYTYD